MRSENMGKIALNAVRLPELEPVNGISWLPRKIGRDRACGSWDILELWIMVKDLRQRPGWRDFAHAQRAAWSLTQGHTLFCQITPF